ncbi:MAG: 2-dehydropantoate 2-reductase [Pseudomonadota bacterium]
MNFAIVGAGALGSVLGAHLIKAGHGVSMVARGARAAHLVGAGLRLTGLVDAEAACRVVTQPATLEDDDAEVLIFAVKTYQMEAALAPVAHLNPKAVVSVANGVMKNEQMGAMFGHDVVMGCMADTSGELQSDGVVRFTRNVGMQIGAVTPDSRADAAAVAAAIDDAGVACRAVPNISTVEWSKFTAWVAMFSLAVVARRPTGQFLSDPHFAGATVAQIREAGTVAAALGVALDNDAPMPVVDILAASDADACAIVQGVGRNFAENAPQHRMSALQDLEAGRRLEVHETLGWLVGKADALGLPVPALKTALQLAAGLDALQSVT